MGRKKTHTYLFPYNYELQYIQNYSSMALSSIEFLCCTRKKCSLDSKYAIGEIFFLCWFDCTTDYIKLKKDNSIQYFNNDQNATI